MKGAAAAAVKSLQSCLTLCNPIDSSPPGSSIPGIPQARTLEWVAISFSNAWKWKVKVKSLSRVRLFMTSWTVVYQAPLSMRFSRQEYWSGLPFPASMKGDSVAKNVCKVSQTSNRELTKVTLQVRGTSVYCLMNEWMKQIFFDSFVKTRKRFSVEIFSHPGRVKCSSLDIQVSVLPENFMHEN